MPAGRFQVKRFPDDTFLLFVALGINITTTFLGLLPLGIDGRKAVYYMMLIIGAAIFLLWLIGKYTFLCRTRNIRPCCAESHTENGNPSEEKGKCWRNVEKCCYCLGSPCNKSMLYDVTVCVMALFYLTGDNLERMVCTEDSRNCPIIGQFFTWTSLILNICITLLKASGTKPNIPSPFPVIGVLGGVYDKLLLIAAQALTIDQTVNTILQSVDLQRLTGNTTLDEKTIAIQDDTAIKIMASLCSVVVFLLLVVLILLYCANWHVCCNYKCETVKWFECVFGEWLCALFVVSFVILFIMGDIDWVYDFYDDRKDTITLGTCYRLAFLFLALVCLGVLSSYYIFGLCVPGVSVALRKDGFFLPKQADTRMTVVQQMVRRQYNEWEACESEVKKNDELSELKGKITVEDHFGKTNITIEINEEIKCCSAFKDFIMNLNRKVSSENDTAKWTVEANIRKDDGRQDGGGGQAAGRQDGGGGQAAGRQDGGGGQAAGRQDGGGRQAAKGISTLSEDGGTESLYFSAVSGPL